MLTQLEADLARRLRTGAKDLAGVVDEMVGAVTGAFRNGSALVPGIIRPAPSEIAERGSQALDTIRFLFEEAARSHLAEVRRTAPEQALRIAAEIATGATIHRVAGWPTSYGDVPWPVIRRELSSMVLAYLRDDSTS